MIRIKGSSRGLKKLSSWFSPHEFSYSHRSRSRPRRLSCLAAEPIGLSHCIRSDLAPREASGSAGVLIESRLNKSLARVSQRARTILAQAVLNPHRLRRWHLVASTHLESCRPRDSWGSSSVLGSQESMLATAPRVNR